MNKKPIIIILLIAFFSLSNQILAQTLIENVSQDFCKCLEYNKIKTFEASQTCMENLFIDNLIELKQYYKV